ncbi:phage tail protein [Azospirillum sp. CT11-132]|uniref:phage tail protein n=1 Tax=Azospirillum sp. CT11-132 TaxID=3396317 RepID=UPI0039A4AF5F
MSDYFIGEIRMFGFNWAPQDWALCQGQQMTVQQNAALYALLGVQFGGTAGVNFNLPDLRGQTMIHQGTAQLSRGGSETVVLGTTQAPSHSHTAQVVSSPTTTNWKPVPSTTRYLSDTGGTPPAGAASPFYYVPPSIGSVVATASATLGVAGANLAHNNMQPSTVVNYCISLTGLWPSRN